MICFERYVIFETQLRQTKGGKKLYNTLWQIIELVQARQTF